MNYLPNLSPILEWMGYSQNDYDLAYDADHNIIIEAWRAPGQPPTPEEIAQEGLPYLRWKRKTDARSDIETYIDGAIQPVTRSMLRDGEPVIDSATAEAVREFIADCYSAVNDFDDAVDLATLETINTVAVDLPAYVGPQQ